jgi:hypothetical protein
MPLLVILLRHLQTFAYQDNIGLSGLDPARRFLLKDVQNIDGLCEADCVDRPVCVAVIVLDNLQNSRPFTLPRLGRRVLSAVLRGAQGKSDAPLNVGRESVMSLSEEPIQ